MTDHTSFDPHELYASERVALLQLVRSLAPAQATAAVPACPAWSIKDVVAHLSGLVAETLADVPPPRGSDEATARQVAARAHFSLDEVCDEWEANADAFEVLAASEADYTTALVCDLVVHAHDIAEALGLDVDESSPGTVAAAERYLALLQERAARHLDLALTVELTDVGAWTTTRGTKPLRLIASPHEFLRSVTGRRTRGEIAVLGWSADPTDLLDCCFVQYGVLAP